MNGPMTTEATETEGLIGQCPSLDDGLELEKARLDKPVERLGGIKSKLEDKKRRNHQTLRAAHGQAVSHALGLKSRFDFA